MALHQELLTIRPWRPAAANWIPRSPASAGDSAGLWKARGTIAILLGCLLVGCGGGEGSDETVVAALGDSITAGSPYREGQYERFAEARLPGTRFHSCGVFGERTDQIAARLEDCARGADVLIVQGGINDIAQMRRVRTTAWNLHDMVRRGKELGLRVALVEVLPWNNGYPFADHRIRRLNRFIRDIGREEDVPVFRWYSSLEDPRRAGRMKAEWTVDGDHPSVEGYRRLGEAMSSEAPEGLFR
jgi:lysophospholipase L1-like esterase